MRLWEGQQSRSLIGILRKGAGDEQALRLHKQDEA